MTFTNQLVDDAGVLLATLISKSEEEIGRAHV